MASKRFLKRSGWLFAVLIPLPFAALTSCPSSTDPYNVDCNWLAGDESECEGYASENGCVSWDYNHTTLDCTAQSCIDCSVSGD